MMTKQTPPKNRTSFIPYRRGYPLLFLIVILIHCVLIYHIEIYKGEYNMIDLKIGDCLEKMKDIEDNSVDFILCDPPYEIGFMSRGWDNTGIAFNVDLWKEALRVLKPGGYLMAFSGARTYHRMAVAIEDAGFEVKDMIEWVYGSGFPKALDISKQLQKKEQEDLAKQYEGYRTQIKPSHEPICLAQKKIEKKTIAENVMKWGTGGLNIDGSRIGNFKNTTPSGINRYNQNYVKDGANRKKINVDIIDGVSGRYPANLIIHENIADVLDKQSGYSKSSSNKKDDCRENKGNSIFLDGYRNPNNTYSDEGGASRFFKNIEEDDTYTPFIYHAKASKKDRNIDVNGDVTEGNNHATVKPTGLMKYLLKMGLPPIDNAVILDMFAGSGSTGVALEMLNKEEGTNHKCILIEREEEYAEIIKKRCCLK